MSNIRKRLVALTLSIIVALSMCTSLTIAQEAPADGGAITAPAEPGPASVTTEPAAVERIEAVETAKGTPVWLVIVNKAWLVVLALLGVFLLAKMAKDEAWRKVIRAGINAVDQVYLAYVKPAKDPNNKEVEWDPTEARRRAWEATKKQVGPFLRLLFKLKGRAWGEALVHKIANARAKDKSKPKEA